MPLNEVPPHAPAEAQRPLQVHRVTGVELAQIRPAPRLRDNIHRELPFLHGGDSQASAIDGCAVPPGEPILPAIGQLELITTALAKLGEPARTISAIDVLRMSRPVGPGETLQLLLSPVAADGSMRFTLKDDIGLVSRGSLTLGEVDD